MPSLRRNEMNASATASTPRHSPRAAAEPIPLKISALGQAFSLQLPAQESRHVAPPS